jgi:hypothetical protein
MTGRHFRNLVLLAIAAGVGYWIYKDRPTVSSMVDAITGPLLGSHAAVKTSERNRVVGDATTAISEQVELPVSSLREGMSPTEVRDLLGDPDKSENLEKGDPKSASLRWTYNRAARVIVFRDNRVASISIVR